MHTLCFHMPICYICVLCLVSRVVNTYGPQTRSEGTHGSNHKANVPVHDCGNQAVEERLQNIEAHLRLQKGLYCALILTLGYQFVLQLPLLGKPGKSVKTITVKTVDKFMEVLVTSGTPSPEEYSKCTPRYI